MKAKTLSFDEIENANSALSIDDGKK